MNKCPNCDRELMENEICDCTIRKEDMKDYFRIAINRTFLTRLASLPSVVVSGFKTFFNNLTGVLSSRNEDYPMHTGDGKFELSMPIVDECIVPTEQEIQVRQYQIARMRTPFLKKSYGRLQVTNKRIIFRSAGRSLVGPIITEKEFAIEEIGGIEIKTDYRFSLLQLILSTFFASLMASTIYFVETLIALIFDHPGFLLFLISIFLLVVTGMVLVGTTRKRALKTGLLSACSGSAAFLSILAKNGDHKFLFSCCIILLTIIGLLTLIMWLLSGIIDDLQIYIKVKGGSDVLEIKRKHIKNDFSGFMIVEPSCDTEIAIREIGALVNDIKLLGDRGIDKWRI